MQRTRRLSDEEIDRLGYEALLEKLGPVGATRYIGLWLERSEDDYAKVRGKIFENMTAEEIYDESVRLESERERRQDSRG